MGVNYFYLKERWPRCGRDAGALEGSSGSVSQLSPPPLVSGWIYGQRAETESDGEFGMEGWGVWRRRRRGGGVISLGFCVTAATTAARPGEWGTFSSPR